MKISIVTISFNQAQYLRTCLESIANQDYEQFEHIVVDPGSTDGSREIISAYPRVKTIFERDRGPADGLNKGFSRATGDIFGFINSDDALLPGALSKVRAAFEQNSAADVICGGGFYLDEEGNRLGRVVPSRFAPWLYAYGAVTLFQQGMFFKRSAFEAVGGFNNSNRTNWDGELFLEMSLARCRFAIVRDELAAFRLQPNSITVSGKYAEALNMDRRRLFSRVMRRDKRRSDAAISIAARLAKFVVDPSYLFRRGLGPRRSF